MITEKEMVSDLVPEELAQKIVSGCVEFSGQIDDLYTAVGMIVVGRLFGWRVVRLASSRKTWTTANRFFGDPKVLIKHERGPLYHRSIGAMIVDKGQDYWDIIKGKISMSMEDRRAVM